MAVTYKVRAIAPVQIRIPGQKHAELMAAGSEFSIQPERFSWRFMKPLGWDPATVKGVPPKPETSPRGRRKAASFAAEVVAELAARSGPKRRGASGAADEG